MKIHITKAPNDPICTRVSVGGNPNLGYYCTYRGGIGSAIAALRVALEAMEATEKTGKEPAIDRRHKELGAS